MSFTYIASPYTHANPAIRHNRWWEAHCYTAYALSCGQHVYSPIVHCHQMAQDFSLPKDFMFWKAYNAAMLSKSSRLSILTMSGWQESAGVAYEISLARELCISVEYILPDAIAEAVEKMRAEKVR